MQRMWWVGVAASTVSAMFFALVFRHDSNLIEGMGPVSPTRNGSEAPKDSSRLHRVEQAVQALGSRQSSVQAEVDALQESIAPPPAAPFRPEIEAERRSQEEALVARLDDAVDGGVPDLQMATQVSAALSASLESGSTVEGVDCVVGLCRIDLRLASNSGPPVGVLAAVPGLGGELIARVDAEDPTLTTIHVARNQGSFGS